MSVYPELRKQLPPLKQWGYFFNNLFKKSQNIGENELKTTQEMMGDLSVVLSIEDKERGDALDRLEIKYKEKYKEAECSNNSALSTTLKKILEISIPATRKRLDGLKKITSDSKPSEQQTDKKKENEFKKEDAVQAREKDARKEKEAAQAEIENERKEKEAAQAENERLKALLAQRERQAQAQSVVAGKSIQEREPKTNSIHENPKPLKAKVRINGQSLAGSQGILLKPKRKPQAQRKPVVARSWGTLYSVPTTPQVSNTAAENANLPGCSYGS
ncbi:hypothetical protein [Rickettsiella endosymbiont of Dermanyssus gallinae]|uniref:hypothetical protein n=1 Tax=Rickettsiella endosymbiont of Dermanyssus gallinae TaxID=2856608 RepID=UPI001C5283CE|nr:hypothetical protein [Rickettsiella endosymbiont of Dermanyssus gallinae]